MGEKTDRQHTFVQNQRQIEKYPLTTQKYLQFIRTERQ